VRHRVPALDKEWNADDESVDQEAPAESAAEQ
jgi:hypothetical protein